MNISLKEKKKKKRHLPRRLNGLTRTATLILSVAMISLVIKPKKFTHKKNKRRD